MTYHYVRIPVALSEKLITHLEEEGIDLSSLGEHLVRLLHDAYIDADLEEDDIEPMHYSVGEEGIEITE